jgi:tetratricopeptide (TPR) repeat protein
MGAEDVDDDPGQAGGNLHAPSHDLAERLEAGVRLERAGALAEADALFRAVVEDAPRDPAAARALLRRAHIHRAWGTWREAIHLAQEGRALARLLGETDLEAELLNAEGAVHQARGALDEAEALFTGMLGIARDVRVQGVAHQNLGANAAMRRDFEDAARRFARSEECFRQAGYRRGEAFALNNRGRAHLDRRRPHDALAAFTAAARVAEEVGDLDLVALANMNAAEAQLALGGRALARELLSRACAYYNATQNPWRVVDCLKLEGDIAHAAGDPTATRAAWTEALDLAATLGVGTVAAELRERLRRLEREPAQPRPRHGSEPAEVPPEPA